MGPSSSPLALLSPPQFVSFPFPNTCVLTCTFFKAVMSSLWESQNFSIKSSWEGPLKSFSRGHFHMLHSSFLRKPSHQQRCPSKNQEWGAQHSTALITSLLPPPKTDPQVPKRTNHLGSYVLSSQVKCFFTCWFFCLKCPSICPFLMTSYLSRFNSGITF